MKELKDPSLQEPSNKDIIDWNRVFYTCLYYRIDIKGSPSNFLADLIDFLDNYVIEERPSKREKTFSGPGVLKYRGVSEVLSARGLSNSSHSSDFSASDTSSISYAADSSKVLADSENSDLLAIKVCANDTDFHEMTPLGQIPSIFLFIFPEIIEGHGDSPIYYGCDIRSLHEFITKIEQRKNPYTNLPFSNLAINTYKKRIFLLERNHVSLKLEEDIIDDHKKYELRVLDIFQIMYNFGYPVDHQWYLQLDLARRKRLYYCLEDLWSYRLDLTKEQKQDVVPYKIFTKKEKDLVSTMKEKDLDELLLTRMRELVSMGKTKDDRINGSMYLLMGLIQVSKMAADSLPQLRYAISLES